MKPTGQVDYRKKRILEVVVFGLLVVATVIAAIAITRSQNEAKLDRIDREKFTNLEVKMNEVLAEFKKTAPEGEWEYESGCYLANRKFPRSNDPIICNSSISTGSGKTAIANYKKIIESHGLKVVKEDVATFDKRLVTSYDAPFADISCSLFTGASNEDASESLTLECGGEARGFYYTVAER